MKLVGYLRVSTSGQAEDGFGLAVQETAVRSWAQSHGHRIVAIFRDEGISGAKEPHERPGLTSALAMVEADQAQGLIAHRLDRLARLLHVQEAILGQVWKTKGSVFLCDVGVILQDDPADPVRTAIRQMMGVFAQLDRATIALRLRNGRAHKATVLGGYAYGSPRFGMRAEDRELVPDSDEAVTVARILELHAAGCSLRQIATRLDEEGRRPKRGAQWYPATVDRVIKRHATTVVGT